MWGIQSVGAGLGYLAMMSTLSIFSLNILPAKFNDQVIQHATKLSPKIQIPVRMRVNAEVVEVKEYKPVRNNSLFENNLGTLISGEEDRIQKQNAIVDSGNEKLNKLHLIQPPKIEVKEEKYFDRPVPRSLVKSLVTLDKSRYEIDREYQKLKELQDNEYKEIKFKFIKPEINLDLKKGKLVLAGYLNIGEDGIPNEKSERIIFEDVDVTSLNLVYQAPYFILDKPIYYFTIFYPYENEDIIWGAPISHGNPQKPIAIEEVVLGVGNITRTKPVVMKTFGVSLVDVCQTKDVGLGFYLDGIYMSEVNNFDNLRVQTNIGDHNIQLSDSKENILVKSFNVDEHTESLELLLCTEENGEIRNNTIIGRVRDGFGRTLRNVAVNLDIQDGRTYYVNGSGKIDESLTQTQNPGIFIIQLDGTQGLHFLNPNTATQELPGQSIYLNEQRSYSVDVVVNPMTEERQMRISSLGLLGKQLDNEEMFVKHLGTTFEKVVYNFNFDLDEKLVNKFENLFLVERKGFYSTLSHLDLWNNKFNEIDLVPKVSIDELMYSVTMKFDPQKGLILGKFTNKTDSLNNVVMDIEVINQKGEIVRDNLHFGINSSGDRLVPNDVNDKNGFRFVVPDLDEGEYIVNLVNRETRKAMYSKRYFVLANTISN